jgi:hypothetical protein
MILFHTTSFRRAEEYKNQGFITPKNLDSFVSFSESPFSGDISENEITLKVEVDPSHVEQVQYNERWYKDHQEQAAYIAGEGWPEQFEYPEDIYDEEGEADPGAEEAAYAEAELYAFLDKSNEREWISKAPGDPVPVTVLEEIPVLASLRKALKEISMTKLRIYADSSTQLEEMLDRPPTVDELAQW